MHHFESDRYTKDPNGAGGWFLIKAWADVQLNWPCLVEGDRFVPLAEDFVFRFHDGRRAWAAEIQRRWVARLNERYVRAGRADRATLAHGDKLGAWVEHTRAIADDVRIAFGDRLADVLSTAAAETAESVAWFALRLKTPPRRPAEIANGLLTIDQWAWDRHREALEELCAVKPDIPGKEAGRSQLLAPAIHRLEDDGLKFMKSDKGWTMRIRTLEADIIPGQHDNLMADVLNSLNVAAPEK